MFATNNCQVNKTNHLEWLGKAYDSQSSHRNYPFDRLCRGRGGGLTLLFKCGTHIRLKSLEKVETFDNPDVGLSIRHEVDPPPGGGGGLI